MVQKKHGDITITPVIDPQTGQQRRNPVFRDDPRSGGFSSITGEEFRVTPSGTVVGVINPQASYQGGTNVTYPVGQDTVLPVQEVQATSGGEVTSGISEADVRTSSRQSAITAELIQREQARPVYQGTNTSVQRSYFQREAEAERQRASSITSGITTGFDFGAKLYTAPERAVSTLAPTLAPAVSGRIGQKEFEIGAATGAATLIPSTLALPTTLTKPGDVIEGTLSRAAAQPFRFAGEIAGASLVAGLPGLIKTPPIVKTRFVGAEIQTTATFDVAGITSSAGTKAGQIVKGVSKSGKDIYTFEATSSQLSAGAGKLDIATEGFSLSTPGRVSTSVVAGRIRGATGKSGFFKETTFVEYPRTFIKTGKPVNQVTPFDVVSLSGETLITGTGAKNFLGTATRGKIFDTELKTTGVYEGLVFKPQKTPPVVSSQPRPGTVSPTKTVTQTSSESIISSIQENIPKPTTKTPPVAPTRLSPKSSAEPVVSAPTTQATTQIIRQSQSSSFKVEQSIKPISRSKSKQSELEKQTTNIKFGQDIIPKQASGFRVASSFRSSIRTSERVVERPEFPNPPPTGGFIGTGNPPNRPGIKFNLSNTTSLLSTRRQRRRSPRRRAEFTPTLGGILSGRRGTSRSPTATGLGIRLPVASPARRRRRKK